MTRLITDGSRVLVLLAVVFAAAASTSSSKPAAGPDYANAPPAQAMEPGRALGLWKSSFGAVKIEEDSSKGTGSGMVHGVWVYQRSGQEVVGYFGGNLRGNVLEFGWQEPGAPAPLIGQGYLVFDPSGTRFSGRWWTNTRDRTGEWSGWRQPAQPSPMPPDQDPYGGQAYGGGTYGYGYPPPTPTPYY